MVLLKSTKKITNKIIGQTGGCSLVAATANQPTSQPAEEMASPSACQRIPESKVKLERRELVMLVVVVTVTAPLPSALRLTALSEGWEPTRLTASIETNVSSRSLFVHCTMDGRWPENGQ